MESSFIFFLTFVKPSCLETLWTKTTDDTCGISETGISSSVHITAALKDPSEDHKSIITKQMLRDNDSYTTKKMKDWKGKSSREKCSNLAATCHLPIRQKAMLGSEFLWC